MKVDVVPRWIAYFLVVVTVVGMYDMTYINLFPRTAPGGDLSWLFDGHQSYAKVDALFQDPPSSHFVGVVFLPLCAAELVLNLIAAALCFAQSPSAAPMVLVANVYILAKTVLYLAYDAKYVDTSDIVRLVSLYIIPNNVWTVVPTVACVQVSRRITEALVAAADKKAA